MEVAIPDVKPNQAQEFELAFKKAQEIISGINGYVSHQLQKCIEKKQSLHPTSELENIRRSYGGF